MADLPRLVCTRDAEASGALLLGTNEDGHLGSLFPGAHETANGRAAFVRSSLQNLVVVTDLDLRPRETL